MDLTGILIFFKTAKSINNQMFFFSFLEEAPMIKQYEPVRIVKKRYSFDGRTNCVFLLLLFSVDEEEME